MNDDYVHMILGAQKSITAQIEKKRPDKMLGTIWGTTSLNLPPGQYGLVIYRGKKRMVFPFTQEELIKEYGSTKWKNRLLARVNEILRKLET